MGTINSQKKKAAKTSSMLMLSDLILKAIEEEQFFRKDVLIPKVRAILLGFNYNHGSAKYNAIEKPSDAARRLRSLEQKELEQRFWKGKIKEVIPTEKMQSYYDELNQKLKDFGYIK